MERLTVSQCRELMPKAGATVLTDDEVVNLRDTLYTLSEVIADAFADLNNIDQSTFEPPNDLDDWLREPGDAQ